MSVDFLPQPNDSYTEDISIGAGGSIIISRPCQIWQISVKGDTLSSSTTAIINISDDSTGYTSGHRKDKIVVTGGDTEDRNYPHGLNLKRGCCVVSNVPGVDLFVSYD